MYSEPFREPVFLTIFFKCEMKIVFVIGVFILDNLIEWTLTPIVCWYKWYEGGTNERTWTLCKNSLGNQCRFHVQLRNNYPKSPFWIILNRFGPFWVVIWWKFDQNFMKINENHRKTIFYKILMKFEIDNLFFEVHYHIN